MDAEIGDELLSSDDAVVDPGGESPLSNTSRNRKPPDRFTYDELGELCISKVQVRPTVPPYPQIQPQGPWMNEQPAGWTWLPQLQRFVWVPPINLHPSSVHMYPQEPLPVM